MEPEMLTGIYSSIRERSVASYLTFIRIHSKEFAILVSSMSLTGIDSPHRIHLGHEIDMLDNMRLGL